jgi:hypothetical protein
MIFPLWIPCFYSNIKSVTINESYGNGNLDFGLFQNIEKGCFKLSFGTSAINHHLLCNLTSLDLLFCLSITDVSCFQNIPHLTLELLFWNN